MCCGNIRKRYLLSTIEDRNVHTPNSLLKLLDWKKNELGRKIDPTVNTIKLVRLKKTLKFWFAINQYNSLKIIFYPILKKKKKGKTIFFLSQKSIFFSLRLFRKIVSYLSKFSSSFNRKYTLPAIIQRLWTGSCFKGFTITWSVVTRKRRGIFITEQTRNGMKMHLASIAKFTLRNGRVNSKDRSPG